MTNSGSPLSASTVVNVEEYVNVIKEGQIKNYIWNAGTSSWVRDPGTVVNLSGVQITVDVSGDLVWCVGQSGGAVVATISGNWVDISGASVIANVSGNAVTVSGNWVNVSGATVLTSISGNWVSVSGSTVLTSVSGNWVSVSGSTVLTSVSGNWVDISGAVVITSVSGNWISVSGATVLTSVSGNWVDISGSIVVTSVSGNWVNISGSYIYPRETIVAYTSGMSLTVNTSATFVHTVTAPQPSYYEYTAIKIGLSAAISTNVITVYLTPAGVADMSGTVITTATLDSGNYSLYVGIPAATPYYPFALLSGDVVAISVPLTNYITGDIITARTVLKTV